MQKTAQDFPPNIVALIANGPYLPGAFVAAASLLECGLREDAAVAIVQPAGSLSNEQRHWIAARYPGIAHVELDAADYLPEALHSWKTALAPLFLRFALAEIFPSSQRILYVDSDILAVRSVDDAFALDLRGKIVGAADDDLVAGLVGHKPSWTAYRNGLRLPADAPYLNCGVLLVDAPAWRAGNIKARLIALFLENRDICRYLDQSALNLMLKGDFAPLSPRWNFQQNYQAISAEDMLAPRLVHFAGSAKPWRNDGFVFRRDYRDAWRRLLTGAPFPGFFQEYSDIGRRQIREAWRASGRLLRAREPQCGIERSQIGSLREKLREVCVRRNFIDAWVSDVNAQSGTPTGGGAPART